MRKLTTEEFIEKAIKIHGNKYIYDKVVYAGTQIKVIINCPKMGHGDFIQTPHDHLQKSGCLQCYNEQRGNNQRTTLQDFIKQARKIHGDKYNYDAVIYVNNHTEIIINCPKKDHGNFLQEPKDHIGLNKTGCPKCFNEKRGASQKSDLVEFIKRAKEIHGANTYNYDKTIYINSKTPVIITCPKKDHGDFEQAPNHHLLREQGCLKCYNERRGDVQRDTLADFIEKAQQMHGDKYSYEKTIYFNSSTHVIITCPKIGHGDFKQTPAHHIDINNATGCPKCIHRVSKSEIAWLDYLKVPNDSEHRQVLIKIGTQKFYVDGYDPKNKIVYEFDGDYSHGNPDKYNPNDMNKKYKKTFGELHQKTIQKQKDLEKAGYTVISVWESEWKKILKKL